MKMQVLHKIVDSVLYDLCFRRTSRVPGYSDMGGPLVFLHTAILFGNIFIYFGIWIAGEKSWG